MGRTVATAVKRRRTGTSYRRTPAQKAADAAGARERRKIQRTAGLLLGDTVANLSAKIDRLQRDEAALLVELELLRAHVACGGAGEAAGAASAAGREAHDACATDRYGEAFFDHMRLHPRRFKMACKHTPEQFDSLYETVHEYMLWTTLDGQPRHNKMHNELALRMPPRLQLFLFLMYCNDYPRTFMMAYTARVPRQYLRKVLKHVESSLWRVCQDPTLTLLEDGVPRVPSREDWDEIKKYQCNMHMPGLEHVECAMDGRSQQVPVPAHDQEKRRKFWSPKEHKFCVVQLLFVTLFGLIFAATAHSASNEQSILKGNVELLEWLRREQIGIVTDANFIFNYKHGDRSQDIRFCWTVGPKTLRRLRALAEGAGVPDEVRNWAVQMLHSTAAASRMRIVAENDMARLRKWGILTDRFRTYAHDGRYSLNMDRVALGLIFITNRLILDTPLRARDWRPRQLKTPGASYSYDVGGNKFLSAKDVATWVAETYKTYVKAKGAVPVDLDFEDSDDESAVPMEDEAESELSSDDEVEQGDFVVPAYLQVRQRAPLNSRRQHVVTSEYAALVDAERGRRKRRK